MLLNPVSNKTMVPISQVFQCAAKCKHSFFFSALFVECLPPKYDVLCLRVVLILDLIQVGTDF